MWSHFFAGDIVKILVMEMLHNRELQGNDVIYHNQVTKGLLRDKVLSLLGQATAIFVGETVALAF